MPFPQSDPFPDPSMTPCTERAIQEDNIINQRNLCDKYVFLSRHQALKMLTGNCSDFFFLLQ